MKKVFLFAAVAALTMATADAGAQIVVNPDGTQSATEPDDADGTYSADEWIPDGAGMSAGQRGVFLDGRRISVAEAKEYSREFPDAMKHFRRGQLVYGVAFATAFIGGYMVGCSLGGVSKPQGLNTGMMVGGVATIGGAVGLTFVTVGQYRKAAAAYNSAAGLACVPRREITLAFGTAPGGIGMRLAF